MDMLKVITNVPYCKPQRAYEMDGLYLTSSESNVRLTGLTIVVNEGVLSSYIASDEELIPQCSTVTFRSSLDNLELSEETLRILSRSR